MSGNNTQGRTAAEAFSSMQDAHAGVSLRISEGASPWWFRTPSVLVACARIALLPLDVVIRVAEALMAVLIVGIAVVAWLWWTGAISDADVVAVLSPVGTRILDMVEAGIR